MCQYRNWMIGFVKKLRVHSRQSRQRTQDRERCRSQPTSVAFHADSIAERPTQRKRTVLRTYSYTAPAVD